MEAIGGAMREKKRSAAILAVGGAGPGGCRIRGPSKTPHSQGQLRFRAIQNERVSSFQGERR